MKYSIIYADPPWHYNNRANHKTRFRGGVHGHYATMTMDEIRALPIGDLAADNCALFMWCTDPMLDEQIPLFKHWGFRYCRAGFSWVKLNAKNGQPFFGVGYYAKSNVEVCYLGIRGRMEPITNDVHSLVVAPHQEHSRKPEAVRERIVQLFGDVPRVELFARQSAPGWTVAGNGIDGQDIRAALTRLIVAPEPPMITVPQSYQGVLL